MIKRLKVKKESINSFYDSIADQYENQLTDLDGEARIEIAGIFTNLVRDAVVLDFGGGTGLDLTWELKTQREIIFIEPSLGMRNIARQKFEQDRQIRFVDKGLNVMEWSDGQLPVAEKVDGVLANFAVLNCIDDISFFFEKIKLVCQENARLVVTIIDPRLPAMVKNYSLLSAFRLSLRGKLTILNKSNEVYHETFLHSIGAIRRAAKRHFKIQSIHEIRSANFVAVCLQKK